MQSSVHYCIIIMDILVESHIVGCYKLGPVLYINCMFIHIYIKLIILNILLPKLHINKDYNREFCYELSNPNTLGLGTNIMDG